MMRKRSKIQKRLAKVVLAAVLCTGGAHCLISPSVAEAGTVVAAYTITGMVVKDGNTVSVTNSNCVQSIGDDYGSGNRAYVGSDAAFSQTPSEGYVVSITGANWGSFRGAELTGVVGIVRNNKLTIDGGKFSGEVAGGAAYKNTGENLVTNNTVVINNGEVGGYVLGGKLEGYGAIPGDVTENTVYINGGQITNVYGGVATQGVADHNSVIISGGTVTGNVYGSYINGAGPGNANYNTVTISGGTVTGMIFGGNGATAGDAIGNTVNISGGTIKDIIRGGYSGNNKADENTVTISGSPEISSSVMIVGGDGRTSASNNTVNILSPITVSSIRGGYVANSDGQCIGNTLNIAAKGVTTGSVNGFQNMNFYLPSDIANNDTMLTVNGGTATDVKGVTFGVAALQGVNLQKGNTVNLITNSSGLTMDDELKTADSASLGSAAFLAPNNLATDSKYELSISKKDANTIIATVDNVTDTDSTPDNSHPDYSNNERLKSLVETRAGMATMINAGTDLLTGQGMSNAAEAAADKGAGGGFNSFGAASIGKLRAESGSHVDTKGIGLNLGFARELENSKGKLLFGPVIEYGHGKYDSYQDNGIKADGHTSYWGLGILAKQVNHNGFYYEGSLRAGRVKSDYDSDLSAVTHASYDSSATYWAAHAGLGKVMDIGKDNTLDVYGKYFYSHTGSDSVTVHATGGNEDINFSAVNSHRLRIGTRLTHAINEKNRIYGGLAWQYEFNGDARATYNGGSTPSPSVKGSSGMMELGWQVKPGKGPMTIDLGVTGWAGKQRGVTANVQANWTF